MKLKKRIYLLLMLFTFVGCGNSTNDASFLTVLPETFIAKATNVLSTVRAFAIIDADTANEYALSVNLVDGTISGQIADVEAGEHTVTVYIQGKSALTSWPLSTGDLWVEIANISVVATMNGSEDTSVTLASDQYVYPDDDTDGISNLDELTLGTDPHQPEILSTSTVGAYASDSDRGSFNCGQLDYLPHPFVRSSIIIQITDAHVVDEVTYLTTQSKWQIIDANDNATILEFDTSSCQTINGSSRLVYDNGMTCYMSIGGYDDNVCEMNYIQISAAWGVEIWCNNYDENCVDSYFVQ